MSKYASTKMVFILCFQFCAKNANLLSVCAKVLDGRQRSSNRQRDKKHTHTHIQTQNMVHKYRFLCGNKRFRVQWAHHMQCFRIRVRHVRHISRGVMGGKTMMMDGVNSQLIICDWLHAICCSFLKIESDSLCAFVIKLNAFEKNNFS